MTNTDSIWHEGYTDGLNGDEQRGSRAILEWYWLTRGQRLDYGEMLAAIETYCDGFDEGCEAHDAARS